MKLQHAVEERLPAVLWEIVVEREAPVIWEEVDEWEVVNFFEDEWEEVYFLEDRDCQLDVETTSL